MNQKASMIALFSLLILVIGIFLGLRIADQMAKETETPTDDVVVGLTRFILSRVEITELIAIELAGGWTIVLSIGGIGGLSVSLRMKKRR